MTLVVVLAYMMGSIPFALLLARRWGTPDLRVVGSGNLGAANVVRASGIKAGVVVALLDVAKGALSVALARYLSDQATAPAIFDRRRRRRTGQRPPTKRSQSCALA